MGEKTMVMIEDLLPQFPHLGPPLPKGLGVLWPWLRKNGNPRELRSNDRVQVVFRHRVVEEPGDLWIDWENELGGGRRAVWEAVRELGEYGFIEEADTAPYDEVYHYWLLEYSDREWREVGTWFGPWSLIGVVYQKNFYKEPGAGWEPE
ncbi:MAG: hypothetical protein ABIH46_07445 [Chloroflexota bacterium]